MFQAGLHFHTDGALYSAGLCHFPAQVFVPALASTEQGSQLLSEVCQCSCQADDGQASPLNRTLACIDIPPADGSPALDGAFPPQAEGFEKT